jgi:hypothetical protein
LETTTRKRGKSVAPSAIDGMVPQADHPGHHALWTREEPADGTIGVPRFLAIVSNTTALWAAMRYLDMSLLQQKEVAVTKAA